MAKNCVICGYRLDDYNEECDTCGACINAGYDCACGTTIDRQTMIEKCLEIDIANLPMDDWTIPKMQRFYNDLSDEKLKKIFNDYYGKE